MWKGIVGSIAVTASGFFLGDVVSTVIAHKSAKVSIIEIKHTK